jgi:hypothetical protein
MNHLFKVRDTFRPHAFLARFGLTLGIGLSVWLAPTARANSIIFASGIQHIGSDNAEINVRAQFDIDSTSKTVTLYLLNLEADPAAITSVLGSLRFDISGAGTSPAPTIANYGFSTFDIDKNGNPAADNSAPGNLWKASNIGGDTIAFCATCASGGNKEMLIGGPGITGTYTGNGSIGPAHSPFIIASNANYPSGVLAGLDTSPSWVLHFDGISTVTPVTISNLTFGFGTGTNYGTDFFTIPDFTESDVPEPKSKLMVVSGLGLVLLSVAARRSLRARS